MIVVSLLIVIILLLVVLCWFAFMLMAWGDAVLNVLRGEDEWAKKTDIDVAGLDCRLRDVEASIERREDWEAEQREQD